MAKLPLSAFDDLVSNEIQHMLDVMRDADVEENKDEMNGTNTIKRSSLPSKPAKSKKKEENIYENVDTNDNRLKCKQKKSTPSNGIFSIPRVYMGAGFMKIFNRCPLESHPVLVGPLMKHAIKLF